MIVQLTRKYMKLTELKEKLKKVKLLAMDVDGTLTDGSLYYSENGEIMKRFCAKDGMGITLLNKSGIPSAIVTSEISQIVTNRAKKLKIEHVILGSRNKLQAIRDLAEQLSISIEEVAYIGDDVNDYFALKEVGFSACPQNAVEIIKEVVDYVCKNDAGNGAVREICDLILLSQNKSLILEENW
ncbi:MAG TPA: HAD-IIIA family hydrolase [Candidatus Kapabacteria bacterium]|nr:HAD-IIIA family hydrolase [Candidatus Kapabacteria bacterium]